MKKGSFIVAAFGGFILFNTLSFHLCGQPGEQMLSSSVQPLGTYSAKDTVQIWAWMETGKSWYQHNADSARLYQEKALTLARKTGFKKGEARCLINLANAVYDLGEYQLANDLCQEAIPICQEIHLKKELAAAYNTLANSWNYQGNRHLAMNYYEKSLKAMENAVVPPYFPIAVRNNLSVLYLDLKLYKKALDNSRNCLHLAIALNDTATAATALLNIGNALKNLHQPDSALIAFTEALSFARISDYQTVIVTTLSNMSDFYLDKGDFREARRLLEESLKIAKEINDEYGKMIDIHGLGKIAFWEKKYREARENYLEAIRIGEQLEMRSYTYVIYLDLSDLALAHGDLDKWEIYRNRYYNVRDSVANEDLIHAVQEMETRYETEKKEKQIQSLVQEAAIRQLTLRQRSLQLYGVAGLVLLLLITGFLGYRNLQNRSKLATAAALMKGQEEERGRLARDLHDGLGGRITGVRQYIQSLERQSDNIAPSLNRAITELDQCTSELRHIARNMMPEALLRFGLKEALEDYCDHLREATKAEIHFFASGLEDRLPENKEIVLFRIVQELLNNAVKYSGATDIIAQITRDGNKVHLTVEDDGKGFDPQILQTSPGVGWMNIVSRVQYLNGILDWHTAPGKGLSVNIESHV
ncbi:MAG: sensor histidine kinase [Bacteroidia bacterium]